MLWSDSGAHCIFSSNCCRLLSFSWRSCSGLGVAAFLSAQVLLSCCSSAQYAHALLLGLRAQQWSYLALVLPPRRLLRPQ